MREFKGKTVLITGGAGGLGKGFAQLAAERQMNVVLADIQADALDQAVAELEERQCPVLAVLTDTRQRDHYESLLDSARSRFGNVHLFFNNAGVGGGDVGWDGTIAINLSGVYYGLFHSVPVMVERGGGAIINTASIAGLVGLTLGSLNEDQPVEMVPGTGAYIAAKHGVVGLTKQYAVAFGGRGVRVNAIAPGYIETPMTEGIREVDGATEYLTSLHPLGRLGQPEEIAAAAAFLASDEASFINGIVLPVDGGYTAR